MTSATPKTCPRCQQVFQPTRRNQRFCSSLCRIDANNDETQKKLALYRQEGPKAVKSQQELTRVQTFYQQQVIVAQGVEEIDRETIKWYDQFYTRGNSAEKQASALGLMLHSRAGLYIVSTQQLMYRPGVNWSSQYPLFYTLKK